MRKEREILEDLSRLCRLPGYIHVVASICFMETLVTYNENLTTDDMKHLSSPTRLIRTEISTLIGFLIKNDIDYTLPEPSVQQEYFNNTYALLSELEQSIQFMLRGSMFYAADSAYNFQYRDFAVRKYANDKAWLETNKGFSIETARKIAEEIVTVQDKKINDALSETQKQLPNFQSLLPAYTFTLDEVTDHADVDSDTARKTLSAFSVPPEGSNNIFRALNDFNIVNARPLIRRDNRSFILLLRNSLVEALYESPFYWMYEDKKYKDIAMQNRGRFTEEFCRERLELVFGKEHVHSNVTIGKSKGVRLGEIDVLVLFADRAIVLQAKSKQLTLEARKGNERKIRDDFKQAIQNSYDQAYRCAEYLAGGGYRLRNKDGRKVTTPHDLKKIYIVCVISDHYPALNRQVEQFLAYQNTETITAPFVMDVFTLDTVTEMLPSPLRLLNYVDRRTKYIDIMRADSELTVLSDHLKNNLWFEEGEDEVVLLEGLSADLDIAMTVRREGVPGERTPDGVLTRFEHTPFGLILRKLEKSSDPDSIALGFMLLSLGEELINKINRQIKKLLDLVKKDGSGRSAVIEISEGSTGLVIYCGHKPISEAVSKLRERCERHKYAEKANSWFGICLSPGDGMLRRVVSLDYKWEWNADMEDGTQRYFSQGSPNDLRSTNKVGRNERCPCGSGLKYKKCCLP